MVSSYGDNNAMMIYAGFAASSAANQARRTQIQHRDKAGNPRPIAMAWLAVTYAIFRGKVNEARSRCKVNSLQENTLLCCPFLSLLDSRQHASEEEMPSQLLKSFCFGATFSPSTESAAVSL